jgi:threonine synthase
MAVSMAKAFGLEHLAMPTNGNAGAALAAYASRAGIRTTVFCPENTPEINLSEMALQGAAVHRVSRVKVPRHVQDTQQRPIMPVRNRGTVRCMAGSRWKLHCP